MHHHPEPTERCPLVIEPGRLVSGAHEIRFDGDGPDELLRQFLRLIRRARHSRRSRRISFRRDDITTLADHLGWSEETVLSELADMMGVTRRQRATMLALLAAGASLITIAEPTAAHAGSNQLADPAGAVVTVEVGPVAAPSPAGRKTPTIHAAGQTTSAPAPAVRGTPWNWGSESGDVSVDERIETGVDDEGNEVAVGQPPVPPGVDDEGNEVAVGEPPVPPGSPVPPGPPTPTGPPTPSGSSDTPSLDAADRAMPPGPPLGRGQSVDVGQPPVPPGVDDDGNHVAVGQPPVPPAPDA